MVHDFREFREPEPDRVIATAYVAIRKSLDDSREWIDLSSMGFISECVEQDARQCELQIPQWARANPIQRIVKVTITEETGA